MKDWTPEIDFITQDFVKKFDSLSFEQLNWKPNANTWSIAQNIEHLIIINETYYPIFEKLKTGKFKTPLFGRWKWFAHYIGDSILKSVQPDNPKKVKTFPSWRPSSSEISADIVKKFENHQKELKQHVSTLEKARTQQKVIHSPMNKNIAYTIEKALEIIVTHEKRHFDQAVRVIESNGFPSHS